MGILNDLRNRVQTINEGLTEGALIRDTLVKHGPEILDLQREQLFEGLSSSGEDIRPYYSEDLQPGGYFRSTESAKRYAQWKETGINYPYTAQRNPDAPNLYINGKFHDELGVQFDVQTVAIVPTTAYAQTIMSKYGMGTFGLMMSKWMVIFIDNGGYNELLNDIKSKLYV